jgi:uncharacterized FAD-dependent dehydrogenase
VLTYTLDIELRDEAAVLARLRGDSHVGPTPDTSYRFVARATTPPQTPRPIVIGTGPCGLFAGLLLAQMGFRPLLLERGKAVRERTQDTWGLWRKGSAQSGIQRAVSAKAVPAPFPTASSTARSRTPAIARARC